MTSHQFVFPPPPPPPPPTQPSYHNPGGPHNLWNNARGNRTDHRRGQGGFNRGSRGGSRGSSRGGSFGFFHAGFDSRPTNSAGHNHPLPLYPPGQQLHYPAYSTVPIAQPTSGANTGVEYCENTQGQAQFYSVQQNGTPYNYNFPNQNNSYNPQQAPQYVSVAPLQANQYPTMLRGPPIRMGFGANNYTAGEQHVQVQHQLQPHPISSGLHHLQHSSGSIMPPSVQATSQTRLNDARYDFPKPYSDPLNRGQKRQHDGVAAQRRHKSKASAETKTKVAPAVPSFGIPLPVSLSPSQETGERPKKKKRRHNQLGLTPKSLEHESSEDENDLDEEFKLANAAGLPSSDRLQFSYKGRTSTLQSFADIAAWIQERKNRFPTKARMEEQKENQRQLKASQQAKREALKESNKPKQLVKPMEKQKPPIKVKEEAESKDGEKGCVVTTEAAKSKAKLEKLRKELKKQEKRIAKAEAKASRLQSEASKYQPEGFVHLAETTNIKRLDSDRPDEEVNDEIQEIRPEVVSQAICTAPTSALHEGSETKNWIISTENEDLKPKDKSPDPPLDESKLSSEKANDNSMPEKAVAENHDIKLEDIGLPTEPFTLPLKVNSSSAKNGDEVGRDPFALPLEVKSSSTKNGEEAGSGDGSSLLTGDNAIVKLTTNPLAPVPHPSPVCKKEQVLSEQNAQSHPIKSATSQSTSALSSTQPPVNPEVVILMNPDGQSISSADSSSDTDSGDDITSSSGSSSSSSSTAIPEAQPVRRALAEKGPPNKRRQNQPAKNICHSFVNNRGFCRKGRRCRYRHELPEGRPTGQGKKENTSIRELGGKNQRISLYQRLVAQELRQEQEEKRQKELTRIKNEEGQLCSERARDQRTSSV